MKKFLFDKIIVEKDKVNFIPFREPNDKEVFLGTKNEKELEFKPTSFKQFLTMLSLTDLNNKGEYNIIIELYMGLKEQISLDSLIKHFTAFIYKNKNIDKNKLIQFYNQACLIKKKTEKEKVLIKQESKEVVK